jgi:2-keto-4-pentenoate hydratase/2-oxohepta-3-ene-1,7-dioic acid hydratase in catechol pathway
VKIATYENGGTKIGVVVEDMIFDTGFQGSMVDAISNWDRLRHEFANIANRDDGTPLSKVTLRAPILQPRKILAIGLNYSEHISEMKKEAPTEQLWFTKVGTTINGPFDPILIARHGPMVDYEVELVVIIGKTGRNIPKDAALAHVFGYCVGNDVTERGWQRGSGGQWSLGKSFDTHAPIGPWITTADEIADPHNLELRSVVNGAVRQNSNTKHMIFDIAQQISHLSKAMTLEPGDIIFTGTPSGVGDALDPPIYLKPGDVIRCEITGIGAIEGEMVAESR